MIVRGVGNAAHVVDPIAGPGYPDAVGDCAVVHNPMHTFCEMAHDRADKTSRSERQPGQVAAARDER